MRMKALCVTNREMTKMKFRGTVIASSAFPGGGEPKISIRKVIFTIKTKAKGNGQAFDKMEGTNTVINLNVGCNLKIQENTINLWLSDVTVYQKHLDNLLKQFYGSYPQSF